jgi:hypothetical protein
MSLKTRNRAFRYKRIQVFSFSISQVTEEIMNRYQTFEQFFCPLYKKASRRSYLQYSLSDKDDDADKYEDNYEAEYEEDNKFKEGYWKRKLD